MKSNIRRITIIGIALLGVSINLFAQQRLQEGIFTVGENTYEVAKSTNLPRYIIWNTDMSELKPDPLYVNGFASEYIRKKITNNKEREEVVLEALGKEKLERLRVAKEKVTGWIYYRPDGSVISVTFSVRDNTILTLDDLVHIENMLQANYTAALESDPPNYHLHLHYIRLNYNWDFSKME